MKHKVATAPPVTLPPVVVKLELSYEEIDLLTDLLEEVDTSPTDADKLYESLMNAYRECRDARYERNEEV